MHGEGISYAYGFWSLVVVNVGLFAFFILSFIRLAKKENGVQWYRDSAREIIDSRAVWLEKGARALNNH